MHGVIQLLFRARRSALSLDVHRLRRAGARASGEQERVGPAMFNRLRTNNLNREQLISV